MNKLAKIIREIREGYPPYQAVTNRQLAEALEAVQYELRKLGDNQ